MLSLLAGLVSIVGLICWVIVVIDAFKDSPLKGLGTIFCCGLYWLYYAIFEFEHERKWLIIAGCLLSNAVSGALYAMSGGLPGVTR